MRVSTSFLIWARSGQPAMVSFTPTVTSPSGRHRGAGGHAEVDDVAAELGIDDARAAARSTSSARRSGRDAGARPDFTGPRRVISTWWPYGLTSPPRRPEGARRQHPLRDLPRARALAACRWPPPRWPRRSACTPTPCVPTWSACATSGCSRSRSRPAPGSAARSTSTRLAAEAPSLGLEPPTFPLLARMLVRLAEAAGAPATTLPGSGGTRAAPTPSCHTDAALVPRGAGRPSSTASASTRLVDGTDDGDDRRDGVRPLPVPRAGRGPSRARLLAAPGHGRGLRRRASAAARSTTSTPSSTASPARSRSRAGSLPAARRPGGHP